MHASSTSDCHYYVVLNLTKGGDPEFDRQYFIYHASHIACLEIARHMMRMLMLRTMHEQMCVPNYLKRWWVCSIGVHASSKRLQSNGHEIGTVSRSGPQC